MPDALLLVGRDRYGDPWHDFVATGACIAAELAGRDVTVEWRSTFPDALESLPRPGLLVVLAGRAGESGRPDDAADDATWSGFHARFAEFVDAGTAVLALHSAANTFADSPHWARLIGGRWVEGKSSHPPIGNAVFDTVGSHPIVSGVSAIRAFDEKYCGLEVEPSSQPFLAVRQGDAVHVVSWVAGSPSGHGRVVYDGLGHDVRSYDSAERAALLRREINWLLESCASEVG